MKTVAFAAACLCCSIAFADPPATAELPTLSRLVIVSGPAVLPGAERTLPVDAAFVAREFKAASFASDRRTLAVGVKSDQPIGTKLAIITFTSDCPDNSVYATDLPAVGAIDREQLKAALIAWTRFRHDAKYASLLSFSEWGGPRGSVDVRLDLKIVGSR